MSAETPRLAATPHLLGTHGLWHDPHAKLPNYVEQVAKGLMEKRGMSESRAIQTAIAAIKRWARGGGNVHPEVRAAAAQALAQWERLKATHNKSKVSEHAAQRRRVIELVGPKGYKHGWIYVGGPGLPLRDSRGRLAESVRSAKTVTAKSGKTKKRPTLEDYRAKVAELRAKGYPASEAQLPAEKVHDEITADEARGNSRPVSAEEFQRIAARGKQRMEALRRGATPPTGLTRNWPQIKRDSYAEARKSWGGATIDAHTGKALESDADAYAITVKPNGLSSVSVPENADYREFDNAMNTALKRFGGQLAQQQHYLGVFHDDDEGRIDIDPVVVVHSLQEVEEIGAYTHAIGGAYHFKSGDGFWPPHVAKAVEMARGERDRVHWKGPGQWHSYAERVQSQGEQREGQQPGGPDTTRTEKVQTVSAKTTKAARKSK